MAIVAAWPSLGHASEPLAFDAYLAASPSLWWNDQSPTIGDGGSTMQEGLDRVVAAIEAAPPRGLTWRYDPMPTQHHATIYDPSARAGLPWLFPPR